MISCEISTKAGDFHNTLTIKHGSEVLAVHDDFPEIPSFYKGLSWIPFIIQKAYNKGKEDGREIVLRSLERE